MNKDESLKLLDRYTGALKKQAGLKEEYEKAISSFSVPEEAPRINSGKIMGPFAGVSLIIATAIRIGLSSSLSYKDTVPVTVGLYVGCLVLSLLISCTIIFFINKDLRKKHTDLKNVAEIAKTGKTEEYLKKNLENCYLSGYVKKELYEKLTKTSIEQKPQCFSFLFSLML